MNVRNLFAGIMIIGLGLSGCNSGNLNQTTATLRTDADSASFYLGYFYGMQMKDWGDFDLNRNALIAGVNSGKAGNESPADLQTMNMFLGSFIESLMMKKAELTLEEGKKFLEENGKKSGITTTESGLQYKVLTEGDGAIPTATDVVRVNYRGRLLDGTEFDSSYTRGEPAEFPVRGVISGWVEALQLMPVGSKWELYIPSDLAYGPRGTQGGPIGPNATLIFEVELLDIVTPEVEE